MTAAPINTNPSSRALTAPALEALANYAGCRNATIHSKGAKTDTLINGHFTLKREFDGILVHACNMEEQKDALVASQQHAGLTFGVLIEGKITFGFNGEFGTIEAANGAQGWATNLTQNAAWQRKLTNKQQVIKLVVSVPPQWIKQHLWQNPAPAFLNRFISTHLARTHWLASGSLVRHAKAVMSSHSNSPSQALHFHANVLAFIAQALDDIEASGERIFNLHNPNRTSRSLSSQAIKVQQHLEHCINELQPGAHIQLEDISHALGMSVSKLQRLSKAHFGCTIAEYIRIRRLEKARHEIQHNNLSIGEAAFLAGYNHRSNFSKAFKQYFNLCPGDIAPQ
ncbi:helix-turn-helix transcriptional regulator [Saccharophagus degradans]|uniref:Transcriptional regulator, AraC family n=1 Tax=Saccharophagus degradans (strain 2-40 / ATCC 43961 / DSM 17024) TaxID=203122 RepID=Q21G91_SACD2|nr:helix-turn-helix transcriptional regulator [Saccharophagus degradans]ABD82288.1 transcriptional regulator, AraC family [Saccharophagus degradans 2-40]